MGKTCNRMGNWEGAIEDIAIYMDGESDDLYKSMGDFENGG